MLKELEKDFSCYSTHHTSNEHLRSIPNTSKNLDMLFTCNRIPRETQNRDLWSLLVHQLPQFSILIKHHNQGNLEDKPFNLGLQKISIHHGREHDSRQAGVVLEQQLIAYILIHKQEADIKICILEMTQIFRNLKI